MSMRRRGKFHGRFDVGSEGPTNDDARPGPGVAFHRFGRGSRIRTDDHLSPRQVRYQAALYPGKPVRLSGRAV